MRLKMVMDSEASMQIAKGGHVLQLNPGGTFGSNPQFKIMSEKNAKKTGELIGKFAKKLQFDAMCPGNHEFDLGLEGWNAYMSIAGVNTDIKKRYLVDDGAYCYESEAQFLDDNESKWTKVDFQKLKTYNVASNVPIFVGANFIKKMYFSVVSENKVEPVVRMKRSVVRIFETPNGIVPVGIIGYLSLHTKHETVKRFNELDKSTVILGDELAYVKKESERLKFMGVNIIIALGFSGIEFDRKIAALPHISAVIGGFSYTFMYNYYAELGINNDPTVPSYPLLIPKVHQGKIYGFTPIAHTLPYIKYLENLVLNFENNGTLILNDYTNEAKALSTFTTQAASRRQNPILLTGTIRKTSDCVEFVYECPVRSYVIASVSMELYNKMKKLLHKWTTEYQNKLTASSIKIIRICKITKFIEGGEVCRKRECEMGGVVADSHLEWYTSIKGTLTDMSPKVFPYAIGVINAGAVRAHLGDEFTSSTRPKTVTTYEIIQVLLGNSPVVVVEMSKAQLIKMFQHSISQWNDRAPSGRLLQVSSNVNVTYDFNGGRDTVVVEGKPISIPKNIKVEVLFGSEWANITDLPYESYRVVTTEHLQTGRNGYDVISQGTKMKNEQQEDVKEFGQKVLADYLSDHFRFIPSSYQQRTTFLNQP